jgi:hypothetical protein
MNKNMGKRKLLACYLLLIFVAAFPGVLGAKDAVMGRLEFKGDTHIEKTSGVWIDDQYVGYVSELKGSKTVLLLPGVHNVTVRQDGYKDFTQQVFIQPGKTSMVVIAMARNIAAQYPSVTSTLKIEVDPPRAAVFVDGQFVGHVGEFEGLRRGMLIAPGMHKIKIALAGYRTFESDIDALPHQKVEVKTRLVKSEGPLEAPLVKTNAGNVKQTTGIEDSASVSH